MTEITLVTLCANMPAFASLWHYIRRRRQGSRTLADPASGDRTGPPTVGSSGRRQKRSQLSSSATAVGDSIDLENYSQSEEHILPPKDGDILRSTRLEVRIT